MNIYPKRLRNMKSLEREKKSLLRERKELDNEAFLPLPGIPGKKNKETDGDTNGALWNALSFISPLASGLTKHLQNRGARRRKEREPENAGEGSSSRNILASVAKELIGGYLKWKAIELSYRAVKHIVKTRRGKKNAGRNNGKASG